MEERAGIPGKTAAAAAAVALADLAQLSIPA
jgi:hypothetical protein